MLFSGPRPQLALTQSISITHHFLGRFGSSAKLTPVLSPLRPSLSPSARCCQGHRAAGEAAGVGWRARSQAAVSEEGPAERVLHGHPRGESHRHDSPLLTVFSLL